MPQKIVITGGSGFIGRNLIPSLKARKYEIIVLTRNPQRTSEIFKGAVRAVYWDGKTVGDWQQELDGADAIVNLAGETVRALRWTQKKKARIIQSRVDAGKAIYQAIANVKNKPGVLIQPSGIGFYGDRGDEILDENSTRGTGFMAEVAQLWEQSVNQVKDLGVPLATLRIGLVLGKDGGFLSQVSLPFKFFFGGVIGSGKPYMSWIHVEDLCAVILFLLEDKSRSGIFNLTAPNPIPGSEFYRTVAQVLQRPCWLHVAAWQIRVLLGEMGKELILSGQHVIPKRLLDLGFKFKFVELESALEGIFEKD
ncbi:MAG: TIGR01777 family protein [Calditrichaeota bacterium]|nr:TIGR01777 family protein [Calditrichota bacterium]